MDVEWMLNGFEFETFPFMDGKTPDDFHDFRAFLLIDSC